MGGAARAALRLHQGLKRGGVDSRMLVGFRQSREAGVIGPSGRGAGFVRKLRGRLDRLPLLGYPARGPGTFTPAWLPDRIGSRIARERPDVVHLHWIADGFAGIESLRRIARPMVWTLHDSWAFTGGCHVPGECFRYRESCGRCPLLGSTREQDLSRRVWERKRTAWNGLPLTLVTPSRWLADCARSSSLLSGVRCEVIPNGLDLERFRPGSHADARRSLDLPEDARIVLFGGVHAMSDPNKGWPALLEALRALADGPAHRNLLLVVFGASEIPPPAAIPVPARSVGVIGDEETLVSLYRAADVFVAPSRQENLPNTVLEAAACGTPSVAFHAGGFPDLVVHEESGYLARPFDPQDLARGIAWVLGDEPRRRALSERARRHVEERNDILKVAGRYVALYREVLGETPAAIAGR